MRLFGTRRITFHSLYLYSPYPPPQPLSIFFWDSYSAKSDEASAPPDLKSNEVSSPPDANTDAEFQLDAGNEVVPPSNELPPDANTDEVVSPSPEFLLPSCPVLTRLPSCDDTNCIEDSAESRIINVIELSKMVEEGQSDIRALQDTDVVLIVGKTGVGKSTLIQLINGAKCERGGVDGAAYSVPLDDKSFLPDFPVGYEQSSKTKMIRSYKHELSGMVFCDMPGYKDTSSFHVDISAAVWINDIARVAKTLRIVVLIHSATLIEDRGGNFRDLMTLLTKLMKGKPEMVAPSCMFFFTHMSDGSNCELDEKELLVNIHKQMTAISRGKNHKKNFLMKILRDFISMGDQHVRVLNPVTTDIHQIITFLQHTVHPLSLADSFLQCSLSSEIQLAVNYAMENMKTSIEGALIRSDLEKQNNILVLFRLLVVFVDLLKSQQYKTLLDETVADVAEKYKEYFDEIMAVVESKAGSDDGLSLVGKEKIELVVPMFPKLRILNQIFQEEASKGYAEQYKIRPDVMEEIQLDYHKKCLLIKLDVLGMMRTSLDDYSKVLKHIHNLQSLDLLSNDMGKESSSYNSSVSMLIYEILLFFLCLFLVLTALSYNIGELRENQQKSLIPDIAQQFSDIVTSVLENGGGGSISRETFLKSCRSLVKERCVQTYYFLFMECFQLYSELFTVTDNGCDEQNIVKHLNYMRGELEDKVHKCVSQAARLNYSGLVENLDAYVKSIQDVVSNTLCQASILTQDEMAAYEDNVRRVKLSYESKLPMGNFDDKYFDVLDQTFLDYLQKFDDLPSKIYDKDYTDSFILLANKIQLVSHKLSDQLPWSDTFLTSLRDRVKECATSQLDAIKANADDSLKHARYGEIKDILQKLDAGVAQLKMLLPDYNSVQVTYQDLYKSMQRIVKDFSARLVETLGCSPFLAVDFMDIIIDPSGENEDGTLIGRITTALCFGKVIDKYDYYNRDWDGQLDFLQEFPRLSPHVSKIKDRITEKMSEQTTKPIHDPKHAIVNCVRHLSDLVWFDTVSPEGTALVKDYLCIAQERCLGRNEGLKKELAALEGLVASLDQTHLDHEVLFKYLSECFELRVLCQSLEVTLDLDLATGGFITLLTNHCEFVRNKCTGSAADIDIVSITRDKSFQVFELIHKLLVNKARYEQVVENLELDTKAKAKTNFKDIFSETETCIGQYLQRLIVDPLTSKSKSNVVNGETPVILCVDASLLNAILEWEDEARGRFTSFLSFVPILATYGRDAAGNAISLREAVKVEVEELVSEIKKLLGDANDFELVGKKIDLLKTCIPLEKSVQMKIASEHTFFFGQLATLQSNVQEEHKTKIAAFEFSGLNLREYLDKHNDEKNLPAYKRYTELMKLITAVSTPLIKQLQYPGSEKDATTVVAGLDKLECLWLHLGGEGDKYDHVREFSTKSSQQIDIQTEISDLRGRMNSYIKEQMLLLKAYKGKDLTEAVKAANAMWEYYNHVKSHVRTDDLNDSLTTFSKELEIYLIWDENKSSEPVPESLAYQLITLVCAFSMQHAKGENENLKHPPISVEEMNNVLDQLKDLERLSNLHPTLEKCIKYDFWQQLVAKQFNSMFDLISDSAGKSDSFATALSILKFASTNFSGSFLKHMHGTGFALEDRIKDMSSKLDEYNKTCSSAFDTEEGCQKLRASLDNLKSEYGFYNGYYTWISGWKKVTTVCKGYTARIGPLQKKVDKLYTNLEKACKDKNVDLIKTKIKSLYWVDKILQGHLKVSVPKILQMLESEFTSFLKTMMDALHLWDLARFTKDFEIFYLFRILLVDNQIHLSGEWIRAIATMHKQLATTIDTCRTDLESVFTKLKFDDVLNLGETIKKVQGFIDSQTTKDYCSKFQKVEYSTGVKGQVTKANDDSVSEVQRAMNTFPLSSDVEKSVRGLNQAFLDKVNDSVKHHEYGKLKVIYEDLNYFYLLANWPGGDKDLMEGTKKAVHNIMKVHMDSLGVDVRKNWTDKSWVKLNESLQVLTSAEEELKYIAGLIDCSLMSDIKQELEQSLHKMGTDAMNIAKNKTEDAKVRVGRLSKKLVDLGRVYDQVQKCYKSAKVEILTVLNHVRDECGLQFIFQLGLILNDGTGFDDDDDIRIGRRLVSDYSHFKDVATMAWNKSVSTLSPDESLKRMECYTYDESSKQKNDHPFDAGKLKTAFEQYETKYQKLVLHYLSPDRDCTEIIAEVLKEVAALKPCKLGNWDDRVKQKIPEILAGIFAYYTVSKCSDSYNSLGGNDESDDFNETEGGRVNAKDLLLTPHNIQVLTILRLLGCGDSSSTSLKNHLMEIGTGEGKSIALGALATIFGILGFSVRCVCYSEYLSFRDHSDFKSIFEAFECDQYVLYSTITSFSEDSVSKQGNTRNMILGNSSSTTAKGKGNPDHECTDDRVPSGFYFCLCFGCIWRYSSYLFALFRSARFVW
jgi:hypothetical protein